MANASWCGLRGVHGPHGASSKEPCPGQETDSQGKSVASPIGKQQVRSAVRDLNLKVAALGWNRTYRLVFGSSANGIAHRLETRISDLVHPIRSIPIGNTLSKAHKYIEAMAMVFADALAERDRQRAIAVNGHSEVNLPAGTRINRTVERANETDNPELVDWDECPHDQAD